MIPTEAPPLAQFAAFIVKPKRTGREELRFLPVCGDCQKVICDVSEANLAVLDFGAVGKLKRIGSSDEFEILREGGRAALLCWPCDRKRGNSVPWLNALSALRGLDEPQRFPEAEYIPAPKKSR
jgi:hypothetical protein